ncbi:SgcJ/EcaC family oxidoreductase [Streptomyces sp. NPDC059649]|uniref:SgcJ/EcaC family oxidoreductase n=1 Tax=Streptomyces sp. NPDC059649 TaxID=3346895 RepID=UPI0036C50C93
MTAAPTATTQDAAAAVRERFAAHRLAWGDADAYGSSFTEDADYITFYGGRLTGREGVVEGHRGLFAGVLKGSRLWAEITGLAFLTPDVALVHARGAVLKGRRTRPGRRALSVQTYVLVREPDGDWRIRAFHNTRHRPRTEALSAALARWAPKGD